MVENNNNHIGIELDSIDLPALLRGGSDYSRQAIPLHRIDPKGFLKNVVIEMIKTEPFLSFSMQIEDVNAILGMKYSSAADIAGAILKDMGLSTKLLKLVNSSFYGHFNTKGVVTVSEAITILGTEEIKLAAANLKIYEFMKNLADVKILKTMTLKALQRSIIARQIAVDEKLKDAEAIQISAMLYELGQYAIALYSPETLIEIEIICDETRNDRETVSRDLFGLSYSELGRYIAGKWRLPKSIILAMNPNINLDRKRAALGNDELNAAICLFSNVLCNIEFNMEKDYISQKIIKITDKFKTCLNIQPSHAVDLINISRQKIKTYSQVLNKSED